MTPTTSNTPTEAAWTIRPRLAAWQSLRDQTGTASYADLATPLNVTENTVRRILTGNVAPSATFIANTLVAFPFASFDRLFTVVPVATA